MKIKAKNYGVFKYSKRPTVKHYRAFITEMFGIEDIDQIRKIIEKHAPDVPAQILYSTEFLHAVKAVFIEKQLEKHHRETTISGLEKYPATISGIAQIMAQKYDNTDYMNKLQDLYSKQSNTTTGSPESKKLQDEIGELRRQQLEKNNELSDIEKISMETDKVIAKKKRDEQKAQSATQQQVAPQQQQGQKKNSYTGAHNKTVGAQGIYELPDLSKRLKNILDEILGDIEIRATERTFNRPSRCAHFIKNAFLPAYKGNKPRLQPCFYIDSSGSMDNRRQPYESITECVAAFLGMNHRRISELHPRYYHFNCDSFGYEFNPKEQLPIADGGTTMRFLKSIDRRKLNVVITDGGFGWSDFNNLGEFCQANPNCKIVWICNDLWACDQIKKKIVGSKQKVVYTDF